MGGLPLVSNMTVQISVTEKTVTVESPYSPEFPKRAGYVTAVEVVGKLQARLAEIEELLS